MMFKTGVILATTATGLLIGAPAAWAACKDDHGTKSSHHHKKHDRDDDDRDRGRGHDRDRGHDRQASDKRGDCNGNTTQVNSGRNGGGLINVSDVNVAVPVNVCDNDILSGVLGILATDLRNNDR